MSTAAIEAVDDATYDTGVTEKGGLTVLDFWAEGCAPCRQLGRVLAEIAPTLPEGVRILTVDATANPALVARFNVRSMPTLVLVKEGAVVETRTGVDRRQVIRKLIDTHA